MSNPVTYRLVIATTRDRFERRPEHRLRSLLKCMGRRFGLRCIHAAPCNAAGDLLTATSAEAELSELESQITQQGTKVCKLVSKTEI